MPAHVWLTLHYDQCCGVATIWVPTFKRDYFFTTFIPNCLISPWKCRSRGTCEWEQTQINMCAFFCACECVHVCAEQERVTVFDSAELPGRETHLGCSVGSEEARGSASSRLPPRKAHIFTPLSELLSGLRPAGALAMLPFLRARQIATNHWHQSTLCWFTLA